jgi:hypothetical protein
MAPPTPRSTPVVAMPTATAVPAWTPYVTSVVTAKGVDASYQAVDPTDHFTPNQTVYVIVKVRNAPAGRHSLTIRWYLNSTRVQLPSTVTNSVDVLTPNATLYFTCSYPSAGKGTAKVYWDLPPNTSDAQADTWLAQAVAFSIA